MSQNKGCIGYVLTNPDDLAAKGGVPMEIQADAKFERIECRSGTYWQATSETGEEGHVYVHAIKVNVANPRHVKVTEMTLPRPDPPNAYPWMTTDVDHLRWQEYLLGHLTDGGYCLPRNLLRAIEEGRALRREQAEGGQANHNGL